MEVVLRVILPALNSTRALLAPALAPAVFPKSAPPTAMISFCLRERGMLGLLGGASQKGGKGWREKGRCGW